MFVDILGATELSAQAGIEQAYAIVTGCLRVLDGIARRHGGVVDKYLSDCLMVVFGVPIASAEAPTAAVAAAEEMIEAAARYGVEAESPIPLMLRIGINTGLMVAGELRGPVVREFAVMGDAVNVAARLKDLGEPGGVHIGPETHAVARARFQFEAGEPLPLRGKTERVPAFRLLSEGPSQRRTAGGRAHLVETPLIGRTREQARLRDALAEVCAGRRSHMLVVRGDEGAGKSRLLAELCAAASESGATVLTGRAALAHRHTTLFLAADVLADWADVGIADDSASMRAKLAGAAADIPAIDAAGLAETLGSKPSPARDATLSSALASVVETLAARRPLVVACEDVQWADDASLALIVRLAHAAVERPVLWILTARPDAPLGDFDDIVDLPPLAPEDAVRLVDHVTGGAALSAVARDRIERRAGGNPARLILGGLLAGAVETEVAQEAATVERASETERRRVTVLFADITGFTRMSEQLPPAESYRAVSGCLAVLHEVAAKHGGSVDKYLGDCIMAVFGAPVAIENAPQAAVNAAIEMRRRVREYNQTAALPTPLDIHVGINTGLGVAGDVSGPLLREFTLMGDAVSLASKLKDVAPAGRIWVGTETHAATRAHFAYAPVEPVDPSRRRPRWLARQADQAVVTMWELQSEREQLHRERHDEEGRMLFSPLVGREEETGKLRDRIDMLRRGEGGIVSIVAEAGLGKSRLVREAIGPARDDLTCLEGRSLAMGTNLRFHPFVDLLQQWAGIGEDDEPAAAAAKLGTALDDVLGAGAVDALPFVATLAGVRLSDAQAARLKDIEGDALEKLVAKHVRDLLVAIAHVRPCILFLEDLHWADQSSIKLLISLLPLAREQPILLVLAYRPDSPRTSGAILHEITARHAHAHRLLRLSPLESRHTLQLLHNLLADHDRPHPAWSRLLAKAGGNPFFVEEVVRSLIDQGAVVRTPHGYEVTDQIETVVVPATVQEVIMVRVDRLPVHARQILQLASVVGRRAPHRLLEAVASERAQLDESLSVLRRSELLVDERARDDVTWTFVHALAHETVYESMLVRTRKALHLEVAGAIEGVFADRIADFHGPLAWHYTRGEQLDKAEEYLMKAGEDAARSAASEEALALFREASRVFIARYGDGGDPRKKARLEKNIGLALLNSGSFSESTPHFDRALRHFGERVPTTAALSYLSFAGNFVAILLQLYAGAKLPRTVADWGREREVWQVLFNRGRAQIYSDPIRLFMDTVAGFRQLNRIDASRIDQAGALYASCASVFCYSGISFAVSRRALAIAKDLVRPDSLQDRFTCATMDFTVDYLEGNWAGAPVIDDTLLDEAVRHGQLWDANTYIGLRADQQLRRGDFAGARASLDRLAVLRDEYGYGFAGGNYDGMRAVLLAEARELDEASTAIDEYLADRHEDPLRAFGLGTKAKIQLLRGDVEGATRTLADAEAILDRSRVVPPWHQSAVAAARLRQVAMRLEAGDGHARKVAKATIASARRVAGVIGIQRTEIHQLIGRIHHACGRLKPALAAWQASVAVGEAMGVEPELARTYATVALRLDGGRLGNLDAAACRDRAHATFDTLGLAWDLTQLRGVERAA